MRQWKIALATVAVWVAASGGVDAVETLNYVVNGQTRTALLARPAASRPSPTIIMLHGANGTAQGIADQTGLLRLAPQNGFVAVFPQANTIVWNRYPPGQESPQAVEFFRDRGGLPDDVGFLKLTVSNLVRRAIVDVSRIYIAGLSNGGFMTLSMVCNEAGLFAGAGLIIASMIEQAGQDCRPLRPLPIVMLNGTADVVVPYDGGPVAALSPQQTSPFSVWSADRTAAFFRKTNGCEGNPERSVLPGQSPHRIEVERATKCTGGPVTAYRVVGGTHGSTPQALSTGQMLLDFFRDNSGAKVAAPAPIVAARPPAPSPAPPANVPTAVPAAPQAAATTTGGVNFFVYRRADNSGVVTGTIRRISGNEWQETNLRGANWKFRSTAESNSEIVLYDSSRDVHLKADFLFKRLFVRAGTSQNWERLADIVQAER